MAGKKGRSGKVSTPAQAQRRAAAASLGGVARWRKAQGEAAPPASDPAAAARAGVKLPQPITWREAGQRQQARLLALKSERAQLELEALRRLYVPIADARAFVERVRAVVLRELGTLTSIAEQIPEGRPHQVDAQRAALLAFAESFRRNLSEIDL